MDEPRFNEPIIWMSQSFKVIELDTTLDCICFI